MYFDRLLAGPRPYDPAFVLAEDLDVRARSLLDSVMTLRDRPVTSSTSPAS
jgi:hypothetical protein